jgi:hypothetical protein
MLRTWVAFLAALLAAFRAATCGSPAAEWVDGSPVAGVVSVEDEGPASRPVPIALSAPAVPEPEAIECSVENPAPPPDPDTRIYATWQKFPLHLAEHGIDGTLRILEDSRFTRPGFVRAGTHPIIPPCDPLPARIEIVDAAGRVVQAVDAFLPQSDIAAYGFAPGQTLYQVTQRIQCIASCWCGDGVSFWRVVGGRFARLETAAGKPMIVRGVTRGCYEDGGVRRDTSGRYEVWINRTAMGTWARATERHWWDGAAWRSAVVEYKPAVL